jgi:CRP-like cAMP-binding protein
MLRYRLFSLLPRISLFGALSRDEVDLFVRPLRGQKVQANEILFREGDPPGDFYLLLEGEIDLETQGTRVTTLGEGELLGAEAPIGIQQQSVTAVARTACVVLVIPPRSLHRLSKENPGLFGLLMINIARDFARHLQMVHRKLAGRPRTPYRGRPRTPGRPLPLPPDRQNPPLPPSSWPRLGRPLW